MVGWEGIQKINYNKITDWFKVVEILLNSLILSYPLEDLLSNLNNELFRVFFFLSIVLIVSKCSKPPSHLQLCGDIEV